MAKTINQKCSECAYLPKPYQNCYSGAKCAKKRSYYRNLENNRKIQREKHRYLRFKDNKCLLCGKNNDLEVHHIIPQSRGGTDDWNNVVTLCDEHHKMITAYYKAIGWENPFWHKFVYGGYKRG